MVRYKPEVEVTKAQFINFSINIMSEYFILQKYVMFFEWLSHLMGVTAPELQSHLSNMNMLFNRYRKVSNIRRANVKT